MPNRLRFSLAVLAIATGAIVGRADAPKGRYDTATQERAVIDTHTGLVWERDGDASADSPAAAARRCGALELGPLDSGWRLPTRAELLSIVDASTFNPAIDDSAFTRTKSDWYWSSTTPADRDDTAWIVNFADGSADYDRFDAMPPYAVRCVR